MPPSANHYRTRTNLPRTCSRSERLAGRGDPRRMASMRSTRYLGTIPPATRSRGSRKPPASRFHWADSSWRIRPPLPLFSKRTRHP